MLLSFNYCYYRYYDDRGSLCELRERRSDIIKRPPESLRHGREPEQGLRGAGQTRQRLSVGYTSGRPQPHDLRRHAAGGRRISVPVQQVYNVTIHRHCMSVCNMCVVYTYLYRSTGQIKTGRGVVWDRVGFDIRGTS